MEDVIFFFGFLILAAFLFAMTEIQIEGKFGWAAKLPTWRFKIKSTFFFFNREITGYHTFIFALILLLPHFAFLFIPWSLRAEFFILSFYILLNPLEDFLWFIFNPGYGLRKFNKEHIKWHNYWFLYLPIDYWILIPLGIILYVVATIL